MNMPTLIASRLIIGFASGFLWVLMRIGFSFDFSLTNFESSEAIVLYPNFCFHHHQINSGYSSIGGCW